MEQQISEINPQWSLKLLICMHYCFQARILISSIKILFPQRQVLGFLCSTHLPSREKSVGS